MIVTIHQPDFLPWLGFFDRWMQSDLYIVLDDVQFIRRGWHHRDKIKTAQGVQWLTIPVVKKGRYGELIKDVRLDISNDGMQRVLNRVRAAYVKAPCFDPIYTEVEKIFSSGCKYLIDLNMILLKTCADILKINTPIVFSSDFNVTTKGTQRLLDLTKRVKGSIYLTGLGSKSYLEAKIFEKENISILWQNYHHPDYNQLHGKFTEKLSVLDFIMMVPNPSEYFIFK